MRVKQLLGKRDNLFFSPLQNLSTIIASIFLGLTVGIQWLISTLLIFGLHPRPRLLTEFTDSGKYWFRPEYDIMVYVTGCAVTLLLPFIFLYIIRKLSGSHSLQIKRLTNVFALSVISFAVHGIVVLFFDSLVLHFWQQPVPYLQKIVVTGIVTLLLVLPGIFVLLFSVAQTLPPRKLITRLVNLLSQNKKAIRIISDFLVLLCIVLLVYVPNWRQLAGKIFLNDQFLHWDGFVVRQALGVKQGLILGRDVFVQYGVGWPFLFSLLSQNVPLTYSFIAGISVAYACCYYIGVYFLLRLLTRSLLWSIGGIGIILVAHLFTKNLTVPFFWETPSSTLLRSPLDIWFFITLFFAITAKNRLWHYALGAICGLALLFGFDTGMYLVVTMTIYYLSSLFFVKNNAAQLHKNKLPQAFAATATFFVTVLSGLLLVGQLAFFTTGFWSGLLEGVREYGSGISTLPMTLLHQKIGLLFFEIILFVYLGFVAIYFLSWLHHRVTFVQQFSALLSLYGLATLLIFLGRSHILNLFHPTIPFWIVLIWFSARMHSAAISRNYLSFRQLVPAGFCIISIVLLFSSPLVRSYPHLVNSFYANAPEHTCLWQGVSDVCGMPVTNQVELEKIKTTISSLQELTKQSREEAIFDDKDTFFYVV